jgi:hypothetical protein
MFLGFCHTLVMNRIVTRLRCEKQSRKSFSTGANYENAQGTKGSKCGFRIAPPSAGKLHADCELFERRGFW